VPASRTRGRAERIAILDRNLRPFAATVGAASIFPVGRIGAYPRLLTQPQASRFGQTREAVGPRLRWGIPPATVTRVIRRALRHRDRPARRVRGDHPAGLTSTLRPVSSFSPSQRISLLEWVLPGTSTSLTTEDRQRYRPRPAKVELSPHGPFAVIVPPMPRYEVLFHHNSRRTVVKRRRRLPSPWRGLGREDSRA
jgi:hypothetical protein